MKKVILIIFSVVFVFLFMSSNATIVSADEKYSYDFLQMNARQSELLGRVEGIIASDTYPSYFGGVFISDDSTHVVVQIVERNIPLSENSEEYTSYVKMKTLDGPIVYEYVNHSYKELNDINDKIIEYYSSPEVVQDNFLGNFVDVFNNVVVIELLNNDTEQIDRYREYVLVTHILKTVEYAPDIIQFSKGNNKDFAIKVGEEIEATGGYCSMGFRAKIDGVKGYFTAGHCFDNVGDSSTGGTVDLRAYGGSVDAAWVKTTFWTNLFNSPSDELEFPGGSVTELNNEACPELVLNLAIAKSGRTTGYSQGQIKSVNYSSYYNGVYFTGLIATDFEADEGDSGGGVFTPIDGDEAGIVKGSSFYGAAFVTIYEIYELWEYEVW